MGDEQQQQPESAAKGHALAALILNAVERLAVVGAITFVWAAGKLDPTIAVVALTAVVGVSLGERRLSSGGKGGGASLVLVLSSLASSLASGAVI